MASGAARREGGCADHLSLLRRILAGAFSGFGNFGGSIFSEFGDTC